MEEEQNEVVEVDEFEEPQIPQNVINASNTLYRTIHQKHRILNLSNRALTDNHLEMILSDCTELSQLSSFLWELNLSFNNLTLIPSSKLFQIKFRFWICLLFRKVDFNR